jgi:hypothetical protein
MKSQQQLHTPSIQAQTQAVIDFTCRVVMEPGWLLGLALNPEAELLRQGYAPALLNTLVPLVPLLTNERPPHHARAAGWWVG